MKIKKITQNKHEKMLTEFKSQLEEMENRRRSVSRKDIGELQKNVYNSFINKYGKEIEMPKKGTVIYGKTVNVSRFRKYYDLVFVIEKRTGAIVHETAKFITIKTAYREERIYKDHIMCIVK